MIVVSPLSRVRELVSQYAPDRVISLLDPGTEFPELGAEYADRHLRLSLHDAHDRSADETVPSPDHVQRILSFLQAWNPGRPVLVHCRAGIGRSTAVGYVAACHFQPAVAEHRIASALRAASERARPNQLLVRLADDLMGRRGRMTTAISDIFRDLPWVECDENEPFELVRDGAVRGEDACLTGSHGRTTSRHPSRGARSLAGPAGVEKA